jgi:hypothetical protein
MLSAASCQYWLTSREDPLQQRKWIQQMLTQTTNAQNNVLDHHVAAHPSTLDWGKREPTPSWLDGRSHADDGWARGALSVGCHLRAYLSNHAIEILQRHFSDSNTSKF